MLPRCKSNQHDPTPQGDQKTSTNQPTNQATQIKSTQLKSIRSNQFKSIQFNSTTKMQSNPVQFKFNSIPANLSIPQKFPPVQMLQLPTCQKTAPLRYGGQIQSRRRRSANQARLRRWRCSWRKRGGPRGARSMASVKLADGKHWFLLTFQPRQKWNGWECHGAFCWGGVLRV